MVIEELMEAKGISPEVVEPEQQFDFHPNYVANNVQLIYCYQGHPMRLLTSNPYDDCDTVECDRCDVVIRESRGFMNCMLCETDFCRRCYN
jgi:hypothetical protein